MKKTEVLIVEDEALLLDILKESCEFHNLEVKTAVNGVEAFENLMLNPNIGIVLSDLRMPLCDGLQLRKKALALPETHQPGKWIALTAQSPDVDENGNVPLFDEVFYKPFSPKLIALQIKKLINEK